MLRPRIIPCLLLHKNGLYKTRRFKNPVYIGDPINAVRIFNDKKADELLVIDIDASAKKLEPNYKIISDIASECRMPITYGGGIKSLAQASKIIKLGIEKVSISSMAIQNPDFIKSLSESLGSQSVVVALDIKYKGWFFEKTPRIYSHNGNILHKLDLFDFILKIQGLGVGEILINSIDRDGMLCGYDFELAYKMSKILKVPFSMLGGAGSYSDFSKLFTSFKNANLGAAAGSIFVFKGKHRAVLINYPSNEEKRVIFSNKI